jgi:hypothetical protein
MGKRVVRDVAGWENGPRPRIEDVAIALYELVKGFECVA